MKGLADLAYDIIDTSKGRSVTDMAIDRMGQRGPIAAAVAAAKDSAMCDHDFTAQRGIIAVIMNCITTNTDVRDIVTEFLKRDLYVVSKWKVDRSKNEVEQRRARELSNFKAYHDFDRRVTLTLILILTLALALALTLTLT